MQADLPMDANISGHKVEEKKIHYLKISHPRYLLITKGKTANLHGETQQTPSSLSD